MSNASTAWRRLPTWSRTGRIAGERKNPRWHQTRLASIKRPLPRELPKLQSKWPLYTSAAAFACLAWATFLGLSMNYERASSSVVRTLISRLKASPKVEEALGPSVKPVPFFVGTDPWVSGSVNVLQGSVDVSFPVQGSKGRATALFTSIRRSKAAQFEILRWKIILPNGSVVDLTDEEESASVV